MSASCQILVRPLAHGSVDLGEAFTYTGSGGRDLKGTKQNPKNLRTAPQTFDQSFSDAKNASLKVSTLRLEPTISALC